MLHDDLLLFEFRDPLVGVAELGQDLLGMLSQQEGRAAYDARHVGKAGGDAVLLHGPVNRMIPVVEKPVFRAVGILHQLLHGPPRGNGDIRLGKERQPMCCRLGDEGLGRNLRQSPIVVRPAVGGLVTAKAPARAA